MQLSLTPRAAQAALDRARDADVEGWLLRIAVVAGGCNGLTYELFFVPEAGAEDAVVEACHGLRVAIDRASQKLLDGTVVDLPRGSSFEFRNPRARKKCSCGASFEV
jgi:iron-sulfur cluster assembly protein